ncbi:PREDICTED: vacuolar protein sorting-associated protein 26B [Rhinopithecus bieti]|uniref:VPS26 retromer complex component B n=2 Tax=Cercopithecidae TaxID=9527 RepID=A0A2K6KD10_RHIBE|nr:PREDICTED: vacuolar protein sorting-associated protein 26B [Rhinopithecus bieti]
MIPRPPARRRRAQLSKLAPARAPSRSCGPITTYRISHQPITARSRFHSLNQSPASSATRSVNWAGRKVEAKQGSSGRHFACVSKGCLSCQTALEPLLWTARHAWAESLSQRSNSCGADGGSAGRALPAHAQRAVLLEAGRLRSGERGCACAPPLQRIRAGARPPPPPPEAAEAPRWVAALSAARRWTPPGPRPAQAKHTWPCAAALPQHCTADPRPPTATVCWTGWDCARRRALLLVPLAASGAEPAAAYLPGQLAPSPVSRLGRSAAPARRQRLSQAFFFFFRLGQSVEVEILLNDRREWEAGRSTRRRTPAREEKYFLFYDGETVSGKVSLALKNPNKRLEHQGIKIEFIGQIELYYDRGNHHEFVSLVKDLARPGEITQSQAFDFEFTHVEKPYESYTGQNVKLRYFLRATISRRLNDVVKEMDIVVHTLSTYPELNSSIKMEVGIEDCLHIEFEYNKSKYHLKDVIVGKIYFLLVRIKIKHMEIDIIKRETTGTGPNVYHENDTIAKYEIMDGAPVRGESIPIRLFLAGYELTPTMRDINKKFSVRYYLNLVLIDEEERRYFKQQEVVLWRKGDIVRKSMSHQAAIASQRFEGTTSLGDVRTPSQLSDNNCRQ